MTAHLNPPSERRTTRLNEAASDTLIPEGVAPRGAAGAQWHWGRKGETGESFGAVFKQTMLRRPTSLILLSVTCSLTYSLDCHMAAIPALDSACHHALTLIGLMCYSFPSGLGRILGRRRLDVSRQELQLSFIRLPIFHTKITMTPRTTGGCRIRVEGSYQKQQLGKRFQKQKS